jgi:hypothetical protein
MPTKPLPDRRDFVENYGRRSVRRRIRRKLHRPKTYLIIGMVLGAGGAALWLLFSLQ